MKFQGARSNAGAFFMKRPHMTHPDVTLRPCLPADLPAMIRLFRETVRTVNLGDYTPEQVVAWAPDQIDEQRWQNKLSVQEGVLAEIAGELAGFCTWDATGYIDLLYVHHSHQRKGVAARLYTVAERVLLSKGLKRLHTQASVTAQPFFLSRGFKLVKHQIVNVRGVDLPNAVMEKFLE